MTSDEIVNSRLEGNSIQAAGFVQCRWDLALDEPEIRKLCRPLGERGQRNSARFDV